MNSEFDNEMKNNLDNNEINSSNNNDFFEEINNNSINRSNIISNRINEFDHSIDNEDNMNLMSRVSIEEKFFQKDNNSNNIKSSKSPKRKINTQKIFNLVSFVFLLTCILFYGFRFIKYYGESHKKVDQKFIADIIKENNKENENFKNINGDYYFYEDSGNNYLKYSNLIWRIIRVNSDGSVTLVLNNPITVLAAGENKDYKNSYINEWLNSEKTENTGIFEQKLNNPNAYLISSTTCIDKIDDVKSVTCKNTYSDSLITIPSLNDYANTGSSKSFMNSEEAFYLSNTNSKNQNWYVDENGKVENTSKNTIMGIKPVITIQRNISLLSGNGSKEEPYEIDNTESLFATYVKLGNDLWQVYDVEGDILKLSLTTYLKINNEEIKYKYSNTGFYHDDTKLDTLAYFLNHNYLNSLTYKDLIIESEYINGVYENYDYKSLLNSKVNTKVSLLSIGNILLNNKSNNYFTTTGVSKNSIDMYVMNNDFKVTTAESTDILSIIPVISIDKNSISKGAGTIEEPYEV